MNNVPLNSQNYATFIYPTTECDTWGDNIFNTIDIVLKEYNTPLQYEEKKTINQFFPCVVTSLLDFRWNNHCCNYKSVCVIQYTVHNFQQFTFSVVHCPSFITITDQFILHNWTHSVLLSPDQLENLLSLLILASI